MNNRFPDVKAPMMQFWVGEHRDYHGRLSLYRVRFVFCGNPGRFMTRMHWIKYL